MLSRLIRTFILFVLAAAVVGAQGRGDAGGSGAPPMNPDPTPFDQFVEKLKLDGKQIQEVTGILNTAAAEAVPVSNELLQLRGKLLAAETAGKAEDVSAALANYTSTAMKMTTLEVRAFKKIQGVLKPNQLNKSAEAFSLIAGIFNVPTRSPRGPRGGL